MCSGCSGFFQGARSWSSSKLTLTILQLHPRNLTWNLKISPWKRKVHLQTIIFRFHVKFRGCTLPETNIFAPENGWLVHTILSYWFSRPISQVLLLLVSGREKKSQLEATKPFKIRVIYQSQQKSPEEVPGRGFTSELCQVRLQVGGTWDQHVLDQKRDEVKISARHQWIDYFVYLCI